MSRRAGCRRMRHESTGPSQGPICKPAAAQGEPDVPAGPPQGRNLEREGPPVSAVALRGFALRRAWRGAARQPGVLLVALLLATVATTVLLAALVAAPLLWRAWQQVQPLRTAEATLFVAPGTASADLKALTARAQAAPRIAAVEWVPRDQALAALAARASRSGVPAEVKNNPLPDVLVLQFDAGATTGEIEATLVALRKLPRVDLVHFDARWHQRLTSGLRAGTALGAAAAAVAALTLALALVAAIRLLTAADLPEVRLLRLVGATDATIARPYAYTGAALLLAAGLLGSGALWVLWQVLAPALPGLDPLEPSRTLPAGPGLLWASVLAVLGIGGAIIGRLAGASAVRKAK